MAIMEDKSVGGCTSINKIGCNFTTFYYPERRANKVTVMRSTEIVIIALAIIPILSLVLVAFNGVPIGPERWQVVLPLTGIFLGAIMTWLKHRRRRN